MFLPHLSVRGKGVTVVVLRRAFLVVMVILFTGLQGNLETGDIALSNSINYKLYQDGWLDNLSTVEMELENT